MNKKVAVEFDFSKHWPFDHDEFPNGAMPGANKYGLTICPSCRSPGEEVPLTDGTTLRVFPFRDGLSVIEYSISGLCQVCQDKVFKEPD